MNRAPIRVGSGYVEILPLISREAVGRMRADLTRHMAQASQQATATASRTAKQARQAVEKEAVDSRAKLRQLERHLTKVHGEEAGKQLRMFRNLHKQREQMEEGTSRATRQAINDVVRSNQQAIRERMRAAQQQAREQAAGERQAMTDTRRRIAAEKAEERALATEVRQVKREVAQAARQAAAEQRQAERELTAAARQRAAEERLAIQTRKVALQEELRQLALQRREYADTVASNRAQVRAFVRESGTATKTAGEHWKSLSQRTETFGTNVEQIGRTLTQNLVMPLAAAAGYMTKIGSQSADMQFLASRGLERAGFDNKEVSASIKSIQDFAVKTPFSLEDMTDKFQQLTRNFQSYGNTSSESLQKSEKLIRGIADFAASYGVMDPGRVKSAMYSADMMMDMSKLNTRSLKQFSRGTGIPINELAKMAGFKVESDDDEDTEAKEFLTKVQERGAGVSSKSFFENFLKAYDTRKGVKGTAENLGTGSIGGLLQSVKEKAQLNTGKLFGDFDPETGRFEWTELGDSVLKLIDRVDGVLSDDDFQELSGGLIRNFVKSLHYLVTGFEWTAEFLNDNPELKAVIVKVAKVAAVLGPLSIAIGMATKTFGKVGKAFSPLFKMVGGLAKGTRGVARTANQTLAGTRAGRGNYLSTYRERRADYHGDDRSLARRGVDRARGQDSRTEALRLNTEQAEAALREVDRKIETVKAAVRALNELRLANLANELGGEFGTSVKAGARDADQKIESAQRSVQQLNQAGLGELSAKFQALAGRADESERHVHQVHDAVRQLNDGKLGLVRQQFEYLKDKADTAYRHAGNVSSEIKEINGRSLAAVRERFSGSLSPAIKGSYGHAKDLNEKIKDVNSRGLGQVTSRVRTLADALDKAEKKAGGLETKIIAVNVANGGGGGGSGGGGKKSRPSRHAMGGVLPGYAPGVDSIPAVLSPGEAILRPEVAHHLGADTINRWNAAAARGRLTRHAKGTAGKGTPKGGPWPLSILDDLWSSINMGPAVGAFDGGLLMSRAGSGVGADTGQNLRAWGARQGGDAAGRSALNRLTNLRGFITDRIPDLLRAAPTGVGQLVGLVAGAVAPTAGQHAWDDIWKGEGNIAQRGQTFTDHMLNPGSIWKMIQDLFGGLYETAKEIGSLAKKIATDGPGKVLGEGIDALRTMFTEMISGVQETIQAVQDIASNPGEFAAEVFDSFWDRAREAMPNTQGLFDFADGGIVPGYRPGRDIVHARLSPGEAVLRPEAVRALGHQAVHGLNRGAKYGTLSRSSGEGQVQDDVTPVPDAEAVEAAAQRIRAALEAMTKAVAEHQAAAGSSWNAVSSAVRSTIDGEIRPAQQRWAQHLAGPLTSAERTFQTAHEGVWSAVQGRVSAATSSSLGQFTRLQTGLGTLQGVFESSSSAIRSSWSSSMAAVDASTRSTIRGPYNSAMVPMLGAMAKLAGADAPLTELHFATGGVVPGYAPGIDRVPAVLSPGEGVLRPEVVRALGVQTIHDWNAAARKGGNVFANGGVVSGGAWVEKHKDEPYAGYEEAIGRGWSAVVEPELKHIASSLAAVGRLSADDFRKTQPWAKAWGKYLDDHQGGGGRVAEIARREFANEAPAVGGSKYTNGAVEAWCADFVSFVVDQAGANAAYGGSPHGAPANRWPAVAQWNAAMQHVPVSSARPGDLLTYGGDSHINIMVGPDETIGGNESNSLKHTRGYNRSATAALRPKGGVADSNGPSFNPWPGSIPKSLFDGGGGVGSGQLTAWIQAAMQATGVSGGAWLRGLVTLVMRESSGDPLAVNNWDSNAASGTHSKGVGQVIDPTFRAYHQSGTSWDIFDPIANLSSVINYIRDRYGDISKVQQANPNLPPKGYWTGTRSASAGLALVGERGPELVDFRGGERVYNNRDSQDLLTPRYEIHIHEAWSEDTTQAVLRAMRYAEAMSAH
ncbi:transglycosylase SLT domain-containing protein [Streptomyces sp. ISL-11]|uniref:transglycosylase SLT domain-containing protein n=1 Tax=Streptomyces sp. ISL-11 TaxID=2819174 RepID=UPI002035B734|nr:transglycosylase SLT domain-containing protein [Streptomyces sp. ISL-11]